MVTDDRTTTKREDQLGNIVTLYAHFFHLDSFLIMLDSLMF